MHRATKKQSISFPKSNVLCSIWQTYLKLEMTIAMIRSIEVHLDSGLILLFLEKFSTSLKACPMMLLSSVHFLFFFFTSYKKNTICTKTAEKRVTFCEGAQYGVKTTVVKCVFLLPFCTTT